MKRVARLIFNRWVLGAIGILAIALLIWFVGPMIAVQNYRPFEPEWVRWVLIALAVLIPVGRIAWRMVKARRATRALTSGLLQPAARAESEASASEVAQLRTRFEEALALLRKLRFGTAKPSVWKRLTALGSQPYLYDLPWYVFIGAPGAGKTTALLNSGLRFPLADRLGREAVRGVGGTRNCDWWFTDEAVFLDTAGRYTTQQSDRDVDTAAWKGFLALLKKSRPRRPVNGVLVTISVADLLQQSPGEADEHARALRARIQELYQDLGLRIPIYVLVTKADLLAGFNEFFAALGRDERGQVWGFSLPFDQSKAGPPPFSAELELLERRLYERLEDRLDEERDPARRALLYGFPQQFASLRERLVHLVDAAFTATKFETSPLLRGVYFTSGTQEGSAIDRVMGALGRALALEHQVLPPQRPSGRSYFLTQLLREVVFAESGLAGIDLKWEQRRQWLERGALVLAGCLIIAATLTWWVSYTRNRAYLREVATEVDSVKKDVIAVHGGAESDLSGLLPTLSSVRTLSETRVTPDGSVPWSWRFGLYQGRKLGAASRAAYQRMLNDTLLPSLTTYLEGQLRQDSAGSQADVYETLKAYLMLYDPKHFNRDLVWNWYETRGGQLVRGPGTDAQKSLRPHFDALYERGWVDPAIPKNDRLVAEVRASLGRNSLPNRIYDRLKREPVTDVKDFTVVEKAGASALLVFERQSREPLGKGVPALYTKEAYYKHFAKRVDLAAFQLAEEETWMLDTSSGAVAGAVNSPKVAAEVKRLYLEDYRRNWRQFINDVAIVKASDLPRSIEIARTLSGPDTPLKPLVKAIEREVTLSVPPEGERGVASVVLEKAKSYIPGGAADPLVKSTVDDQFEDIRRLAGPGLDAMVQQLNEFYQYLIAADVALRDKQSPPAGDSANKLRADAARQPEPIRTMLQSLVESSSRQIRDKVQIRQEVEKRQQEDEKRREEQREAQIKREKETEDVRTRRERESDDQRRAQQKAEDDRRQLVAKKTDDDRMAQLRTRQLREQIDLELRTQVAGYCTNAINGRYPFVRTSKEDVTPEDFSRLFSPNGVLDGFFQKTLAPHVDTGQIPWRFRDPILGASAALPEFQRAQVIRDIFFRGGGGTPSIQLEFKPVEMDSSILQFMLDVDGKLVRYAHGPQVPVRVQFPGPGARSQVRISITPPSATGSSGLRFDGPWALFRMFDGVKIEETKQFERFVATVNIEGRRAVFEVYASSVRNPFRLPELTQFRCPTSL